ncbi:putative alcohol dehydrogenase class III [Klebsiella variicola]|nr:putative alcohol dehydrogenase class III [Klebsiella variicola]
MATAVAVYHRFVICAERADRIIKHGIHQRCIRVCSYRPAHYLAIKAVDNRRQIHFSSRKLEPGNIGQPLFIWAAGTKIPGEQIFRCRADFSTVRVVSSSPGALNNELFFCHHSADNLLRNKPVVNTKHRMKTSIAVAAVVFLKDLRHDHTYFRILITQALAGFVVKIAAAGKLQNAKQLSNGILFRHCCKFTLGWPFVLLKVITFQRLCSPDAFRPADLHNKILRPGLYAVRASPQYL